jgi:DNA-binding NarL/FixJ family response regulator
MDKIRVLLGNHPMMVPNSVRQLLEEQQDMEVVGDCRGPMKILQEVGRSKADAVILAQEGSEEPGLCSQLLAVYPDLTIVSVSSDLAVAYAQQLRSHRRHVATVGCPDVVKLLRTQVSSILRSK